MGKVDISEICDEAIKTALLRLLEKQAKSKEVKVSIEPGSKKGDNFIGTIYRILYEKVDDENNRKQSSLILKIASQNPVRRQLFKLNEFFGREIIVYKEVLPYFNEFQLSKGVIPIENGFNEYAKCYESLDMEMSECLLLEDLRNKQMEMINHRETEFTHEYSELVMKALGKFHAISFALKDQRPNKFAELIEKLPEIYFEETERFLEFFSSQSELIIKSLKRSNRPDLAEKFEQAYHSGLLKAGIELVSGENAEPYAVICHADAWINNCMFRHDIQGKPDAVNLIDWQFSRYASPITDIVLNLICCTSKAVRDTHYEDLLKTYHNSLSDLIRRLGSDPDKLFSYDTFLGELKKYGKYSLIVGSLLIPLLAANPDDIPDLEGIKSISELRRLDMNNESQPAFDKSIRDVVDDLIQFGYL